jgi:hypothetical protein
LDLPAGKEAAYLDQLEAAYLDQFLRFMILQKPVSRMPFLI